MVVVTVVSTYEVDLDIRDWRTMTESGQYDLIRELTPVSNDIQAEGVS